MRKLDGDAEDRADSNHFFHEEIRDERQSEAEGS